VFLLFQHARYLFFSYKIVVHNMNSEIAIRREQFLFFSDYIHHQIVCLFVQGCGLRHWAAAPYWLDEMLVEGRMPF